MWSGVSPPNSNVLDVGVFYLNSLWPHVFYEKIPVRMLEITPQSLIGFDVNETYAKHYSRTTYANDVNDAKLDAGPTSILNIRYASYSRGNFTPEKASRKRCKKIRRADVRFWIGVST